MDIDMDSCWAMEQELEREERLQASFMRIGVCIVFSPSFPILLVDERRLYGFPNLLICIMMPVEI